MSALILAFCAESERRSVAASVLTPAPPMLLWHDAAGVDVAAQHRPLFLLAIGPEGGAALARWVDAHGLEGVTGVGLVGVTAPWAEREFCCSGCSGVGLRGPCPYDRTPLGPLEPLRAVAEGARAGVAAGTFSHTIHFAEIDGPVIGSTVKADRAHPLRIVIACAPDDGVCRTCGGSGEERIVPPYVLEPEIRDCATCGGTCGALSSADVALELSGERCPYDGIDDFQATTGGLTVIHYPTHVVLAEHGLAAVLKAVGS